MPSGTASTGGFAASALAGPEAAGIPGAALAGSADVEVASFGAGAAAASVEARPAADPDVLTAASFVVVEPFSAFGFVFTGGGGVVLAAGSVGSAASAVGG